MVRYRLDPLPRSQRYYKSEVQTRQQGFSKNAPSVCKRKCSFDERQRPVDERLRKKVETARGFRPRAVPCYPFLSVFMSKLTMTCLRFNDMYCSRICRSLRRLIYKTVPVVNVTSISSIRLIKSAFTM